MYEAVTHRVKVTVEPAFDPERSDPDRPRYFWRYAIEIANLGDKPVTLIERHWRITDADGRQQEVQRTGRHRRAADDRAGKVVPLHVGLPADHAERADGRRISMVDPEGRRFKVSIPAFSLDSPDGKRVLN